MGDFPSAVRGYNTREDIRPDFFSRRERSRPAGDIPGCSGDIPGNTARGPKDDTLSTETEPEN